MKSAKESVIKESVIKESLIKEIEKIIVSHHIDNPETARLFLEQLNLNELIETKNLYSYFIK